MCLYIKHNSRIRTAKEDKVVYKVLLNNTVFNRAETDINNLHGKDFTAVIKDHRSCNNHCSGKISIKGFSVYFCTNDENLDGKNIDEKFEFKNSWVFTTDSVKSVIIDGEELIVNQLQTKYRYSVVNIGETYNSEIERPAAYKIEMGLHSFVKLKDAKIYESESQLLLNALYQKVLNIILLNLTIMNQLPVTL